MNRKTLYLFSILLASCSLPSIAFGYGEGWSDEIPLDARQLHLLVNEARCDTQEAIAPCKDNYCLEKACYTTAKPPYYWNDLLSKSSQLHANMHAFHDEATSSDNGIDHPSMCALVSNIATLFPDCDGHASCACQGGSYTGSTDTFVRVKYFTNQDGQFYSTYGENIAQSGTPNSSTGGGFTTGSFPYKNSPGFYYYVQLLTENRVSGEAGVCGKSNGNGHRFSIIGSNYNSMGAGTRCGYFGSSGMHCVAVIDYGTINKQADLNPLTSGSHYTAYNELWFKTHYYSQSTDVQEDKVYLNLNGECKQLTKTRGRDKKNEVFGIKDLTGIDECTPYYYEALDANGDVSSFPTSGSLLFMADQYVKTAPCQGKTWKNVRATSCFATGPKCKSNEHLNQAGTGCEADSITACGSYDNDCTKLTGWTDGKCEDKVCTITNCAVNFYPDGAECKPNDINNCGSKGYKCATKVTGWNSGSCTNAECVVDSCKSGYHKYDKVCEAESDKNCGSHGNNCAQSIANWQNGTCENGSCKVTECKSGFHLNGNTCEADSADNCGTHGKKCEETIIGWAAGTCTNAECVATSCKDGFHTKDGACESDGISICGPEKINCTEIEGWSAGSCESNHCIATKCQPGYHVYEQSCEADSTSNCGQHDRNCSTIIDGWKSGECTDAECIVTACVEGKEVKENQCKSDGNAVEEGSGQGGENSGENGSEQGGENSGENGSEQGGNNSGENGSEQGGDNSSESEDEFNGADVVPYSESCSGTPMSGSDSAPIWILLGIAGIVTARRRKTANIH